MGDDEFFKRIAETEPVAEVPAGDRPIGTAGRRGLSVTASGAVQRGLEESEQEPEEVPAENVEEQTDAAIDNGGIEDEPSLRQRLSAPSRRALRAIKTERRRIAAISGAALAVGLALTTVLVGVAGPGGNSTPVDRTRGAEELVSKLESVQADQRMMHVAFTRERAARRAELRSIAHERDRSRRSHDSGESVGNQQPAAPVQATGVGTTESFGFERPVP